MSSRARPRVSIALLAHAAATLALTAPALGVTGGAPAAPDEESGVYRLSVRPRRGAASACSAAAIAPRLLLTAGHCVSIGFVGRGAALGVVHGGVEIPVREVFLHPDYDQSSLASGPDLAILALDVSLPAARSYAVAPLPRGVKALEIEGYGVADPDDRAGETAGVLRRASLGIWRRGEGFVEVGDAQSSACYGDSGAPLFFDGEIVAVMSHGAPGCRGGMRATLIAPYVDFLDDFARDAAVASEGAGCAAAGRRAPASLAWAFFALALALARAGRARKTRPCRDPRRGYNARHEVSRGVRWWRRSISRSRCVASTCD